MHSTLRCDMMLHKSSKILAMNFVHMLSHVSPCIRPTRLIHMYVKPKSSSSTNDMGGMCWRVLEEAWLGKWKAPREGQRVHVAGSGSTKTHQKHLRFRRESAPRFLQHRGLATPQRTVSRVATRVERPARRPSWHTTSFTSQVSHYFSVLVLARTSCALN